MDIKNTVVIKFATVAQMEHFIDDLETQECITVDFSVAETTITLWPYWEPETYMPNCPDWEAFLHWVAAYKVR